MGLSLREYARGTSGISFCIVLGVVGLTTAVVVDRVGAILHERERAACAAAPERCDNVKPISGPQNAKPLPTSASLGPSVDTAALDRHLAALESQIFQARKAYDEAGEAFEKIKDKPTVSSDEKNRKESALLQAQEHLQQLEHKRTQLQRMLDAKPSVPR